MMFISYISVCVCVSASPGLSLTLLSVRWLTLLRLHGVVVSNDDEGEVRALDADAALMLC